MTYMFSLLPLCYIVTDTNLLDDRQMFGNSLVMDESFIVMLLHQCFPMIDLQIKYNLLCTVHMGFYVTVTIYEIFYIIITMQLLIYSLIINLYFFSFQDTGNDYVCICPYGFNGRHCESSATSCEETPCKNSAVCIPLDDGYKCVCSPGYAGVNCEENEYECASHPCLNGM